MSRFENPHLKDKTLEELIDDLARPVADPDSPTGVAIRLAIQATMTERLATPKLWAGVSLAAAVVSAVSAAVPAM